MSAPRFAELVIDYKKIYGGIVALDVGQSPDALAAISSFGGFLKRAEKELEGMREQMEQIVDARSAFTQHLSIFTVIKITVIALCCLNMKRMSMWSICLKNKRNNRNLSLLITIMCKRVLRLSKRYQQRIPSRLRLICWHMRSLKWGRWMRLLKLNKGSRLIGSIKTRNCLRIKLSWLNWWVERQPLSLSSREDLKASKYKDSKEKILNYRDKSRV